MRIRNYIKKCEHRVRHPGMIIIHISSLALHQASPPILGLPEPAMADSLLSFPELHHWKGEISRQPRSPLPSYMTAAWEQNVSGREHNLPVGASQWHSTAPSKVALNVLQSLNSEPTHCTYHNLTCSPQGWGNWSHPSPCFTREFLMGLTRRGFVISPLTELA